MAASLNKEKKKENTKKNSWDITEYQGRGDIEA